MIKGWPRVLGENEAMPSLEDEFLYELRYAVITARQGALASAGAHWHAADCYCKHYDVPASWLVLSNAVKNALLLQESS